MEPKNIIRSSEHLWSICPTSSADILPWGKAQYDNVGNCDDACQWFVRFDGDIGVDWGVCANPKSHRSGLLTFEGFSCPEHQYSQEFRKMIEDAEKSGFS